MAEIKISELSVGDWVRWTVYNKTYDICISQITDILVRGVHDGVEYGMKITQLSPIPITAEILDKNGLCVVEEDADFSEYELFGSEFFSLFHTKGTLRYRLETPQASVVCWNVHQLQHALRLAKVDKEIEL